MKTQEFTDAIGKQADSDVVKHLLHNFGIDRRVAIKRDETDVYENITDAGVSLLFESERYVSAKHKVEFPTDAPILTAIFLYGTGDDEFCEYKGDLPEGLTFSDSRESATQKLGSSEKYNPDRNSEFWDFSGNVRFFVRYAGDEKTIERIQFGILWR
ncbi:MULTISPECIES: hypothetical protein [unclassified Paraburkholderia]|uniref:hypothetical protein n=1 Tax=unclassified Paraburkholderia TaxID=2615204 RepID=UPI002AB1C2ED|nr:MULTISPECIES: hypothetical protein [unclassified Paraburkholderia]